MDVSNPVPSGIDKPVACIPEEAIKDSDRLRKQVDSVGSSRPPVDKYSSEKVSPNQPTNKEVKAEIPDDSVNPG